MTSEAGQLGVVVAGTGFGCVTHVRALRAAGFDVKAVVGRDPKRTAERAALFGVPLGLTDLDQALSLPGVIAITIATPPHTHAALALAAVAAGKHVICEKPFARDAAEGRVVLQAAEAAGVVHLLGTEFRWDPGQATLARTLAAGLIGQPRMLSIILHVPVLAGPGAEVPAWWADTDVGGGWLGAHGSQVIDQVRVMAGEFESVSALLPKVGALAMSAEDSFIVQFRLRSGAVGLLQSTAGDPGPPIIVTRIAGSEGTAWIDGVGSSVWVADASGTHQVHVGDDLPTGRPPPLPDGAVRTTYDQMIAHGLDLGPYTCLATRFRDLILGRAVADDPRPATFADGVAGMAVLDAIRRSAASASWVAVEDR